MHQVVVRTGMCVICESVVVLVYRWLVHALLLAGRYVIVYVLVDGSFSFIIAAMEGSMRSTRVFCCAVFDPAY